VDDCSSSIKNDASNVKAYYRRAKARMELGKLNDAKNDVNQILKLDPSNAEAKQMLRQISGKSLSTLFGPTKPTPPTPSSTTPSPTIRQSYLPGVKTVLGTPKWFSMADDDDEDLYSGAKGDSEKNYPKKILPIRKPAERRSKV
jgi:tetratricopeptide (TPR) repeat protein